jgi:hypothetical protein
MWPGSSARASPRPACLCLSERTFPPFKSSPGLAGRSSNPCGRDREGRWLLDARIGGHDNRIDMRAPCRDAAKRPEFAEFPLMRGNGAPKSADPMAPRPKTRGRLSARQSRQICRRRPRFRRKCPAAILPSRLGSSAPRLAPSREAIVSSWQGLVMGPGGAPALPERDLAKITQGLRTSSRLTTPHDAPFKWTRSAAG